MGTLTVRENLHFSASLRLPGRLSKQEREERVEATLSDLGLYHVAESKVCSCFRVLQKNLDGGEGNGGESARLSSIGHRTNFPPLCSGMRYRGTDEPG